MTATLTEDIAKLNDRSEKPISGSSGNSVDMKGVCVWGADVKAPQICYKNLELSAKLQDTFR
jgi:hypothetical protein